MRYKCLVLDHDDTVADSTKSVHHPAFMHALKTLRPGVQITLDEYFAFNFSPGFMEYCEDTLHFTEEEMNWQGGVWEEWVQKTVPGVYPAMKRIIRRQKAEGGLVCVVSHSFSKNILRDYRENGLPAPDMVFGWEAEREKRKPSPYPLYEIMNALHLKPEEMLMVDDLKPGYDMAKAAGVPFAGALWAHSVKEIREFMQENCENTFLTPEALETYLF